MQIAFSGRLGSGKSTVCAILKEKYGYEIYSTGTVQRKIAEEMGISTLELNKRMMSDPKLDHVIDDTVTQISRERRGDKLVFDSRMAWHFAEDTFKVYMYVDPTVAAERVFNADRGNVEKYESIDDAKEQLLARTFEENKRYKAIYGVDNLDLNNYDLVIDSTSASPEQIAETMIHFAKEFEKCRFNETKVLFAPRSIAFTESASNGNEVSVTLKGGIPYCISGHEILKIALDRKDILISAKIVE